MSDSSGTFSSRSTLKVQRYRTKDFGRDVDGDLVPNPPIADDVGDMVKVADVVNSLNRMVKLHRLTPDTRNRIVEQLGLK
jgi:hypothetical protein